MKTIDDRQIRKEVSKHLTSFLTDERNARLLEVIENRTRHITIVIEDLYQTQNISAVMRTCECLGIQDVHIVEAENDFSIHKAISMGADKWLTKYHYPAENSNIVDCISQLKQKGYSVIATLPGDDSCYLDQLDLEKPMAFLFGTELTGLSEEAIKHADKSVKIPMYGFTTSFNISNSVAIIATYLIEKLRNSQINWKMSDIDKEIIYLEWLQKSIKTPELIIEKFLSEKC